jgi:hypothetical protein
MLLFGNELASFAPLYEVFGVNHGRGPVETRSIGLADQIADVVWKSDSPPWITARSWRPSNRKIHFIKVP